MISIEDAIIILPTINIKNKDASEKVVAIFRV
jgi:hypothetical protein